jgi:phospholipid-binding lipoprotein MlaA
MSEASLDAYAFQRDAYFQYREALVNDKPSGDIDYTDTADYDYNFEEYTEESTTENCTNKLTTENCKAQKISQAE